MASLSAVVLVCRLAAQGTDPPGALGDMPLPGGLRAAMRTVGDPAAEDRGQFLADLIRRSYNTDPRTSDSGGASLRALAAQLSSSTDGRGDAGTDSATDMLPLPLPPALWSTAVFAGHPMPHGLLGAILESRDASLFYYGLLSLDDDTREWLAGQPDLVADIASRHAAAFVLASPAIRVARGAVAVPGGVDAEPVWEAIVGGRAREPVAFVRALLGADSSLAHFFGATAPLTTNQIRFALRLDAPKVSERLAAAQALRRVFTQIAANWNVQQRTFWRPPLDPMLLLSDLRRDAAGRPMLPGGRRFWTLAFAEALPNGGWDLEAALEGGSVDFAWLCDQVFSAFGEQRSGRYAAVLYASRLATRFTPAQAADALVAVRATMEYPALVSTLGRAQLDDPPIVASTAVRAAQLSNIRDPQRAVRAVAQFQGTLALLVRAASRLALSREKCTDLIASLSSVNTGDRGDYEGALVRWIHTSLGGDPTASLEDDLLRLVTGTASSQPQEIEWEGTSYRVDLAGAEAVRVTRLLGEHRRPYFSSAVILESLAGSLASPEPPTDGVQGQLEKFSGVAHEVGWDERGLWTDDVIGRYRAAHKALERSRAPGDRTGRTMLAGALRVLADDLLARGLTELTYATALGRPERAWINAGDVARRHAFDIRPVLRRSAAWQLPKLVGDRQGGNGVVGSVLGLDVELAELGLVRLSFKPPPRRPMLRDVDRRACIEAAALVDSTRLTDGDRDAIAAGMRRGRERVAALRTLAEASLVAEELRLSPARASLLRWTVVRQPARVNAFLSAGELLTLGIGEIDADSPLHAWGASAAPRLACSCLRLPQRQPWEIVAGRWGSGMLISTLPDLNLRLAEFLSDMHMPAALLGPVLASATLDYVNTTVSRDEDDRRGLIEYIQELDQDRFEQYLAVLTTDGPLKPLEPSDAGHVTDERP